MTTKTTGLLALVLGPAAVAWLAGLGDAASFLGLGALLAIKLGVQARTAEPFALLLPVIYLTAAITAGSTDAVVALVVAIAAAVGASSSLGLHRGLTSLLAVALIGSFSPPGTDLALAGSGWLLAGSLYGWAVAATLLRGFSLPAPRVESRAELAYALLLACVTLVGWFAARAAGIAHPWWLPLAVVAVSEPLAEPSAPRALLRTVLGAVAAMVLVFVTDVFETQVGRVVLLLPLFAVGIAVARQRRPLAAVFLAPALLLLSGQPASHEPPLEYLVACLVAFVPVVAVSSAGHWACWTSLRASRGVATSAEPGSA